ncbi:MAG: sulfotransferase domain-containing protein [Fimbriimonadaceae bacterium]|nr:sulfotransferase domain-containing protein [Chitinophagales bacterium]
MQKGTQDKLPTFIVVGANKGGTTSLYHYLKQHPEVYLSPLKEPHYFSKDIDVNLFNHEFAQNKLQDIEKYVNGDMQHEYHAAFVRNWEQYKKLYKNVEHQTGIGELSTSYLYSTVAAEEIKNVLPECKIIICLRNPIDRAYSHYRMNIWTGNNNEFDFYKALQQDFHHKPKVWGNAHLYVEIGQYYEQVKRYLDVFGKENVKIIFTEDMKESPQQVIKGLYEFIGVDSNFNPDTSKNYNEVFTPRYKNFTYWFNKLGIRPLFKKLAPRSLKNIFVKIFYRSKNAKGVISPEAKQFLLDQFSEDVKKLSGLLGKDLNHWLN